MTSPEQRPAIPREMARAVLVEAGHRCAIPTCRQPTTELHHIVPWATVREHAFDNLIALCPNDHARAGRNEIDRKALLAYKRNLAILTSRYSDAERRLLDLLADQPTSAVRFDRDMAFDFYYLLQDGLLIQVEVDETPGVRMIMTAGGVRQGPRYYALTTAGREFLDSWVNGTEVVR